MKSILLKMVDAKQRMINFERKYAPHPYLPLVVDLVEYYPDQRAYEQAAKDFWKASQEYAGELSASEAV